MSLRDKLFSQIPYNLNDTNFDFLGKKIEGKVRDSYVKDGIRTLITSDRLSAFDVILTTIPFKGQVLNQTALHWFKKTEHIIDNHIIDAPHPNVFISEEVDILPIEVVIRGYLTGSAWRDYKAGKDISGIRLAQGIKKSQQFETPILTPSTKAERGEHDMPISSEEIVKSGIIEAKLWQEVSEKALALFKFGQAEANKRGLILVDTKYEFGIKKDGSNKLILADEVHTQDSSRYWILDSYEERFKSEEEPQMLDKEYIRGWLMEQGYMGEGTPPNIPEEVRVNVAERYIQAYEKITGLEFRAEAGDLKEEISRTLKNR